ncbi:hypothetical protein QYM36_008713 [Artemia franciscana]|uniref:Fatty acyl-CoA reductase n=2 Tax=Artemia franciscana TaxID=6661 RepID=A0AA88HUQ8_ARTSF|nr:hypothetical protein QYM36_008713 [Artemia franciscana]
MFGAKSKNTFGLMGVCKFDDDRVCKLCWSKVFNMSEIAPFYTGKSVLVTGATGFFGKVLLEKLLTSCPDIKIIYVLIRQKADKSARDRLEDIYMSGAFENVREKVGGRRRFFDKIVSIAGDVTLPNLGVDDIDLTVIKHVSVVFHCAADVKFETPLKQSLDANVEGTKRVVGLCKAIGKPVLIYVSSAYATCNRLGDRDEVIYPPKYSEDVIAELAERNDATMGDAEFYDGHPNSYTLSKALAESYLESISETLPVVIVRPSQVTPSLREPFPGWIDNAGGPTGLIAAVGKGIIRRVSCDPDIIVDFIPVDVAVHLMIAAAYDMSKQSSGLKIYNCTTSGENPMMMKHVEDILCNHYWRENPLQGALLPPYVKFQKQDWVVKFQGIYLHTIPAYAIDMILRLTGQRPMLVRAHQKLGKALKFIRFFMYNEWKYHAENTIKLHESLSPEDQETFMFDIRKIEWNSYYNNYTLGVRHFLFRESPGSLAKARKKIKFMEGTIFVAQCVAVFWALSVFAKFVFF